MIHPFHRLRSVLAVTLALTACTAAPAAARLNLNPTGTPQTQGQTGPCSEVCSGGSPGHSRPGHSPQLDAGSAEQGATLPHNPQHHVVFVSSGPTSSDSFDWGDAAVGAGGAIVVLLVAAGGARATATRRARHAGGAA